MFNIADSASLLDAMSNPTRLTILRLLSQGEVRVGELNEAIGMTQSALSQHLSKLRSRNLVQTRRDAQSIYYRCESAAVLAMLATLHELFAFPAL